VGEISVVDDFGDVFGLYYALSAEQGFTVEEVNTYVNHITTQLYAIRGVEKVQISGLPSEEVNIWISPATLSAFELRPESIARAIREQNSIVGLGILDTGEVEITLTEGRINANGKIPNADDRIDSGNQNFKLMPGGEYEKDPTIKVDANSESCYIYVQVVNEIAGIEDAKTVATQMAENGWTKLDGVANVYCKKDAVAAGSTHVLFSTVKIRGDVDNATLPPYMNKTIKITGYAVQSFGFTTAKDAWTAANFTL
jgi:multidrug efflux pump subunit AcrB